MSPYGAGDPIFSAAGAKKLPEMASNAKKMPLFFARPPVKRRSMLPRGSAAAAPQAHGAAGGENFPGIVENMVGVRGATRADLASLEVGSR